MTQRHGNPTNQRRERLLALMAEREEELRARIAERRAALEHPAPGSEPPGDCADLAFVRARAEIDHELIDRHLLEIGEIERARARLAAGSHGTCIDCDTEIEWARLQASPAALRCADCQVLHEKALARTAHALHGR